MGFLAEVKSFARRTEAGAHVAEAKVAIDDGADTLTALALSAPGDDAPPLPGDLAYLGDDAGAGAAQIVGYQDPATPPVAAAGERRIYSRSGPGAVAAEVWLKGDGSLVLSNALGRIELGPDGRVMITTPLGTYSADLHQHTTPFGPSGPPIPGT